MSNINLLPWREEVKEEQKRKFFMVLFMVALFAVIVVLMMHFLVSSSISDQNQSNNILQQEIKHLDVKLAEIEGLQKEKEKILVRMKIISELQAMRPLVVKLLEDLAKTMPDGLYLTDLSRQGMMIKVEGKAESNSRVSRLMRNIEASSWLKSPTLSIIKANEANGADANGFILQVEQVNPFLDNDKDKTP